MSSDSVVVPKKKTWARGSPAHKPTDQQRMQVLAYAAVGTPHNDIAVLIGISIKTLLKRYRKELDLGKAKGNSQIGGRLFKAAMGGSIPAMIFWMKSQAGWREKEPTELRPADIDAPPPVEAAEIPENYTPELALEAYLRLTQD